MRVAVNKRAESTQITELNSCVNLIGVLSVAGEQMMGKGCSLLISLIFGNV
jgi:hypothetical protein